MNPGSQDTFLLTKRSSKSKQDSLDIADLQIYVEQEQSGSSNNEKTNALNNLTQTKKKYERKGYHYVVHLLEFPNKTSSGFCF